jgi:hypothetical protein
VQEHGLPHSDSRGLFRTGSKELQAVLTPTNSGEESPRLPTSRHNSAHFSTERVARELASDDLPDLYVGSFLEVGTTLALTLTLTRTTTSTAFWRRGPPARCCTAMHKLRIVTLGLARGDREGLP